MSEYMQSNGPEKAKKPVQDDALFEMSDFEDDTDASADESSFDITTAEAAGVAQSIIEAERERVPEKVAPAERLMAMKERFGFLPRTSEELNDAYGLTGEDLPGGAATKLNTIFHRQRQHDVKDPSAAVRAIVSRYVQYAKNAKVERGQIAEILMQITDDEGNADLGRLSGVWQDENSLSRPLIHGLWRQDAGAFIYGRSEENPLTTATSYVSSNKDTLNTIQELMDDPETSAHLVEALQSAQFEENQRHAFWVDILKQSRKHALAAGVAYKGLKELGELTDA